MIYSALASALVLLTPVLGAPANAIRALEARGSVGINLNNAGSTATFCMFENTGSGASWSNPISCTSVAGGSTQFISVPSGFIGRVQRGQDYPATWVEFDTTSGYADVSLIQGTDH